MSLRLCVSARGRRARLGRSPSYPPRSGPVCDSRLRVSAPRCLSGFASLREGGGLGWDGAPRTPPGLGRVGPAGGTGCGGGESGQRAAAAMDLLPGRRALHLLSATWTGCMCSHERFVAGASDAAPTASPGVGPSMASTAFSLNPWPRACFGSSQQPAGRRRPLGGATALRPQLPVLGARPHLRASNGMKGDSICTALRTEPGFQLACPLVVVCIHMLAIVRVGYGVSGMVRHPFRCCHPWCLSTLTQTRIPHDEHRKFVTWYHYLIP